MIRRSLFVLFFLCAMLGSLQAGPEKQAWQERYLAWANTMGYSARIDSDGDVEFRYENWFVYLEVNDEDPGYFRVFLPNLWRIDNADTAYLAMEACLRIAAETKVIKAYLVNDSVWISAELFLKNPQDFADLLPRCLRAMELGVEILRESMGDSR